jgi:hypothetical protein
MPVGAKRHGLESWPVPDEQQVYITVDGGWTPTECPLCKQTATSHGWLFNDPPPRPPLEDKRRAIGDVFMHADLEDCVRPPRLAGLLSR